ncbi:glucosaminidase domain-containing protein [Enterococcus sp. CSURQ0835]|uniref:glucosaminidase domain-containing protein n=1 Tax=Enterococcus sp. CSURQ0835 TaxID=2681394 RepID=UPI0013567738|nr:glucosaminidase domain-containing protein [Enterococcus sp. CSURQ0835]
MKSFTTRTERLFFKRKQQQKRLKQSASLLSVALSVAPAVATLTTLSPTDAQAAEIASTQNNQALIEQLGQSAVQVAAANDLYASIMVAQALLESGFGSSALSQAPNYNLFGVKEYGGGPAVYMATKEYVNGQWTTMSEPFSKYSSYYESFVGHVGVLASSNYAGAWKSHTNNYQEAAHYLTGRYATAPNYGSQLISLIQTYDLTRFDTGTSYGSTDTTAPTTATSTSASGQTYTVQNGDSLWTVAQKNGLTFQQLLALNGLTQASTIVPGQQLNV